MCIRDRPSSTNTSTAQAAATPRSSTSTTSTILSLIYISEPTRLLSISYAVFCLKKKNEPSRTIEIRYLTDQPVQAGEYHRHDLLAGDQIAGPAVIREPLSTTFVVTN